MKQSELEIKLYLHRILNILMMNGGFLDNPGLYIGEIRLVLLCFRYARFTKKLIYRDYGFELLERIQNSIHQETPVDYKQGLAGIGSSIEYFVQESYIEADTDEILEDFDNRVFSIRNLFSLSFDELLGILYYTIWRISGSKSKKEFLLNSQLPSIINTMEEWLSSRELTHPIIPACKSIFETNNHFNLHNLRDIPAWNRLFYKDNPLLKTESYSHLLEYLSNTNVSSEAPVNGKQADLPRQLGFHNGLAGLGMALLTELDGDDSWYSLFPIDLVPVKK